MSGPKCAGYTVDDAVVRERRRRQAAMHRYSRLQAERQATAAVIRARKLRSAVDVVPHLGSDLDRVESADTGVIEAWCAGVAPLVAEATALMAQVEQGERASALANTLAAIESDPAVAQIRRRAADARAARQAQEHLADAPPGVSESAKDKATLLAEIELLVSRLDPDSTSDERDLIEACARDVAAGVFGSSGLVELGSLVQKIGRTCDQRRRSVAEAERLLVSLDGLTGSAVEWARRLLANVRSGGVALLDVDAVRIAEVRAKAEDELRRLYVAEQLAVAFASAGCEIEQGFKTDVTSGSPAYIASRESSEHAIEVILHGSTVDLRVVRATGSSDAKSDTAAEVSFCRDLGTVSAQLHRRGVDLTLLSHEPAGALAVEIVPGAGAVIGRAHRQAPLHRTQDQ